MKKLEKILEEIKQRVEYYRDNATAEYVDVCAGLREAERIIRKHMNDGWIPAKERWPEEAGVYDFTVKNGIGVSVVVTWQFLSGKHLSGMQTLVDGKHYLADNIKGDPINALLIKNVIAWRKRPEPYTETTSDEKHNSWIPAEERLPDSDEIVLVQVSGKPNRHIELVDTCEFAEYDKEEGWILENYPGWKNPKVEAWMRLPDRYKK